MMETKLTIVFATMMGLFLGILGVSMVNTVYGIDVEADNPMCDVPGFNIGCWLTGSDTIEAGATIEGIGTIILTVMLVTFLVFIIVAFFIMLLVPPLRDMLPTLMVFSIFFLLTFMLTFYLGQMILTIGA